MSALGDGLAVRSRLVTRSNLDGSKGSALTAAITDFAFNARETPPVATLVLDASAPSAHGSGSTSAFTPPSGSLLVASCVNHPADVAPTSVPAHTWHLLKTETAAASSVVVSYYIADATSASTVISAAGAEIQVYVILGALSAAQQVGAAAASTTFGVISLTPQVGSVLLVTSVDGTGASSPNAITTLDDSETSTFGVEWGRATDLTTARVSTSIGFPGPPFTDDFNRADGAAGTPWYVPGPVAFADDFTRADSIHLGGPWQLDDEGAGPGEWGISGDVAYVYTYDVGNQAFEVVPVSGTDGTYSLTIGSFATGGGEAIGLIALQADTHNRLLIYATPAGLSLYEEIDATYTSVLGPFGTVSAGDVISLTATGKTIEIFHNGTSLGTHTTTLPTGGASYAGLFAYLPALGVSNSNTVTDFTVMPWTMAELYISSDRLLSHLPTYEALTITTPQMVDLEFSVDLEISANASSINANVAFGTDVGGVPETSVAHYLFSTSNVGWSWYWYDGKGGYTTLGTGSADFFTAPVTFALRSIAGNLITYLGGTETITFPLTNLVVGQDNITLYGYDGGSFDNVSLSAGDGPGAVVGVEILAAYPPFDLPDAVGWIETAYALTPRLVLPDPAGWNETSYPLTPAALVVAFAGWGIPI